MSQAFMRATRTTASEGAAAGWTDCDLHPSLGDIRGAIAGLGIRRAVIGTRPAPSVTLSPEPEPHHVATRFVIAAPADPAPGLLRDLHRQGVRGVRFALPADADHARAELDTLLHYADRIVALGWHVELTLTPGASLTAHEWTLMRCPVAVCLGGLGAYVAPRAPDDPDTAFLLDWLHLGRVWLKLCGSAPRDQEPHMAFVRAAVRLRADRIVWGSGVRAAADRDGAAHVAEALAALARWVPDDRHRDAILVGNPSQLYGFSEPDA